MIWPGENYLFGPKKPECLTHPLVTMGLDSMLDSYLTPKNRDALARVNRVCQGAIEKKETWEQLMTRSHLRFLTADPTGNLSLTDKKSLLEKETGWEGFKQKIRYYSGYHDSKVHQAVLKREGEIKTRMDAIKAECEAMQELEFVNIDEVKKRYDEIEKLETESKMLENCLKLQKNTLAYLTHKTRCLARIIYSFVQCIFNCFSSKPVIKHSHKEALEARKCILYGKKLFFLEYPNSPVPLGYPIGSTKLAEADEKNVNSNTAIEVYTKHLVYHDPFKVRKGVNINLVKDNRIVASCTVYRRAKVPDDWLPLHEDNIKGRPLPKTGRELYIETHGSPDTSSGDNPAWRKMIQVAVELLMREDVCKVKVQTVRNESELWVAGGFDLDCSDTRVRLMGHVLKAHAAGMVISTQYRDDGSREARLYKTEQEVKVQNSKTRLVLGDGQTGATVSFDVSGKLSTWEEIWEKEGRILKGAGPVLPHIP